MFTNCTRSIDCWQKVLASLINCCSQCCDHAFSRDMWVWPPSRHKIRSGCLLGSWNRTHSRREDVNRVVVRADRASNRKPLLMPFIVSTRIRDMRGVRLHGGTAWPRLKNQDSSQTKTYHVPVERCGDILITDYNKRTYIQAAMVVCSLVKIARPKN